MILKPGYSNYEQARDMANRRLRDSLDVNADPRWNTPADTWRDRAEQIRRERELDDKITVDWSPTIRAADDQLILEHMHALRPYKGSALGLHHYFALDLDPEKDTADMAHSTLPAFVPPARPVAEATPPEPPAVAALTALLSDREREKAKAEESIEVHETHIRDFTAQVEAATAHLMHSVDVLAAVDLEIAEITKARDILRTSGGAKASEVRNAV